MNRLKGLALTLVAVFAIGGIVAANAAALEFTAAEYPATLDGTSVKGEPTIFTLNGKEIVCEKTTLSGTLPEKSSTLLINREYSECSLKGTGSPVTITMNGCAFELHLETKLNGDIFEARVDIVCEGFAGIEIHVYANAAEHAAGKSICTYELLPQNGLKTVEANNMTEAGDITITPRVKNISYKVLSGTKLLCGESGNTGTYTGSTTVTGTNKAGGQIKLEVK